MTARAVASPARTAPASPGRSRCRRPPASRAGPGRWAPRWDGGVNFAVFASAAERVELCLFDADGSARSAASPCPAAPTTSGTASCRACGAGTRYGLRVHGPYEPQQRLALQPAQAAARPVRAALDRPLHGARLAVRLPARAGQARPAHGHARQRRAHAAKCVVVDPHFDWGDDAPSATSPMEDSVFYEVHVRGFTRQMPDVPEHLRGTFAGLASRAGHRAPEAAGRHRGRTAAGARLQRRAPAGRPGPGQLLGLQHASASSRPSRATCAGGDVERVPAHGQGAARGRPRSDPRRGLQPQLRGQPPRARRCASRASTTAATTG